MATIAEQMQSIKAWIRIRKETVIRVLETLQQETEGTSIELKAKLRELLVNEDPAIVRAIINFKTLLDEVKNREIKPRDPTLGKEEEDLPSEEEDLFLSEPEDEDSDTVQTDHKKGPRHNVR